jgi:hypothetical protein
MGETYNAPGTGEKCIRKLLWENRKAEDPGRTKGRWDDTTNGMQFLCLMAFNFPGRTVLPGVYYTHI